MHGMDVVIMAAGKGTRLRPLTDTTPKPLVPIHGRGTLLRLLDVLPEEIDRIIVVVGYLQEQIRTALGASWNGKPVVYVEQTTLNGTGGALRAAESVIVSDRFLVINGDDVYAVEDLQALVRCHRGLIAAKQVLPRPLDTWEVRDGAALRMTKAVPTGAEGWVNTGAYLLGKDWFLTTPVLTPGKTDEYSLPHALPELMANTRFEVIPATRWMMCGTPEELAACTRALAS